MGIEVNLLIAIIGIAISISSFFIGRQMRAKDEGFSSGIIKTQLEHMSEDIKEIKAQGRVQNQQFSDLRTDIEIVKRDLKTAFHKIDEIKTEKL